jgi:SAM-dependent methyltransferase
MTDVPTPIDYIDRWHRIVAARREQHDAACAAQGRTTDDYWARRAEGYRKFAREQAARPDPFVDCVRRHLRPEDTVLDVGAGTGRHALRLAPHARRVVALDPSDAMLRFLREDAASEGLSNVDAVDGAWPEVAAEVPPADIVVCAHVLYPIEDVVPFLRALDVHARRACFLHLMGHQPWFDLAGLWEAVHGQPRRPQPTYVEAVEVLHQLGCHPSVEVEWLETAHTFDSLDDAVQRFADSLAVGEDPDRLSRLRDALAERLQPLEDGRLALGEGRLPLATVWWEAGALRQP